MNLGSFYRNSILLIFIAFTELLSVYWVYSVVTQLVRPKEQQLSLLGSLPLEFVFLITIGIYIAKFLLSYFVNSLVFGSAFEDYAKKTQVIFENTIPNPDLRHSKERKNILSILNVELMNLTTGYILPTYILLSEMSVIFLLAIFYFWLSPYETLALVACLLPFTLLYQIILRPYVLKLSNDRQVAERLRVQLIETSYSSSEEIFWQKTKSEISKRLYTVSSAQGRSWGQNIVLSNVPKNLIEIYLIVLVFLFFLIYSDLENGFSEAIPFLSALGAGAVRILPSLNRIIISLQHRGYFKNLKKQVQLIEQGEQSTRTVHKGSIRISRGKHGVNLKTNNVVLDLGEQSRELNDIDIRGPGIYKLDAPSGFGKTTLLECMLGFRSIETYDQGEINIAYVPQFPKLISGSLRSNLDPFGALTDNKIFLLANELKISDLVNPKTITNFIEGNKDVFSGGEMQKLGLLKALLSNPDIILLDEFGSALDLENRDFYRNYIQEKSEFTLFIVSSHYINFEKQKVFDLAKGF